MTASPRLLRVAHAVETYLPTTQNWLFRLLEGLPSVRSTILSKEFLHCNFYSQKFSYVEFPLRPVTLPSSAPIWKVMDRLVRKALALYPTYVKFAMGEVDILHSHFANVGWEYDPVAKRYGIPHLVSFYGLDYEYIPYTRPIWYSRYRKLFASADAFIVEGQTGLRLLQQLGCPRDKILVSRLGIEAANIPFRPSSKPKNSLRLLQVASFTEKKGQRYTVEAFLKALPSCPNMTLTLVGAPAERGGADIQQQLQAMVRAHSAEAHVDIRGPVEFRDLHCLMADFDVFIHPSCYTANRDSEGAGAVVLLDAQATGLPVISTLHCDIPENVVHERTGLLTPETDSDALAESIQRFYAMDEAEYRTFAERARAHVVENYRLTDSAQRLRAIYERFAS